MNELTALWDGVPSLCVFITCVAAVLIVYDLWRD
jgi:hypothetical protein